MQHEVVVRGLPSWMPPHATRQLLGPGSFTARDDALVATLDTETAADLAARLRSLCIGGSPLQVECRPRLKRPAVRAARTREARRMRDTTPGFLRPGTRTDEVGRFSLTPEALALRMGRRAHDLGLHKVVDACCGVGGNAIGFARAGCRVVTVDTDPQRLAMARHNAARYGVADRIRFVHGDAATVQAEGQLLFLDPPWGDWSRQGCRPSDFPLMGLADSWTGTVWAKLPTACDPHGWSAEPVFGEASGDARRIKFLWLSRCGDGPAG